MVDCTAYVGLDVHQDTIFVAVAKDMEEVVSHGPIENSEGAIRRVVRRLAARHDRVCLTYEAGPCGYGIYRLVKRMGHSCLVAAPSMIPRRPGDRIKTDRRDAMTLARLLRSGDLTGVWVPDPHHEAVRELVRCRDDFKQAERRCRQRLCSLVLRHGRRYGRKHWTREHWRWLRKQRFDIHELQVAFDEALWAVQEAQERVRQIEGRMLEALEDWSLEPLVRALMAMRGVREVTAMTLVAELGDLSRFRSPRELMAFVGMVPREHSSGQMRRQGGITKNGNRHVRRVLTESAWAYRHKPAWTRSLRKRAAEVSEAVRVIAWKAQKRLHSRYRRLMARGKRSQVVITAVAREELGFIWAIGQRVMQEQREQYRSEV